MQGDGRRGGVKGQAAAGLLQFVGAIGGPQTTGADLGEALGQDVLEEPADEFIGAELRMFEFLGAVVAVDEGDLAVLKSFEPAVADGDAEDIAAQILQDFVAAAGVLAVNHPLGFPGGGGYLPQVAQPFEAGAEFAAEDFAQGEGGNQEGGIFGGHQDFASADKPPALTSRWTWG